MATPVPCPRCRNPRVNSVGFTWWGGLIGPRLISHTQCPKCQFTYNGKTGKSNRTAITIYLASGSVLAAIVIYLVLTRL